MTEASRSEPPHVSAPDFLRRVVDGAFERASPLEPRRPSLFEPRTVARVVAWPAELAGNYAAQAARTQVEGVPEAEPHRQAAPSDARVSREPPRIEMDLVGQPKRREALETRPPVKADREPEDAASVVARSRGRPHRGEPDRSVLTPKPLQTTMDAGRDGRPEPAQKPLRPVLDSPSGALLAQKVISAAETMRAPESREALPQPTVRSARVHDHPEAPAPAVHRIIVEPPTARHRSEREAWHGESATPSPEPVVNVTIGRIEVRAVPAQSASNRQRSQGPKPMSLDDYLKQRGGGQ